jgi:hypothetical protein
MKTVTLKVDEYVFHRACQRAEEQGETLEGLLAEYVTFLADRAGRRLTVREEIYADYRPSDELVEVLRAEADKARR